MNELQTAPAPEGRGLKEIRRGATGVGWRLSAFAVLVILLGYAARLLMDTIRPGAQIGGNGTLLLTIVVMYVISFPLLILLFRIGNPEVRKPEKKKMKALQFILSVPMCAGLVGIGAVIGAVLNFLVSGTSDTALTTVMLDSNPFLRILTVGILAPIVEELIFRKLVVDHLLPYGKWLAVLASGLTFGLYHGNFAQAVFATLIGMFFAMVYIRTGRIGYTIAYHMLINLATSVVTLTLIMKTGILEGNTEINIYIILFFIWIMFLAAVGLIGIILLIVYCKQLVLEKEEGPASGGGAWKVVLTSWGMLLFFAVCVYLFVTNYIAIGL